MTTPIYTPEDPRNPRRNISAGSPPVTPGGPGGGGSGLSGQVLDAYQLLTNMLKQWGLESLAPDVLKFLQQGYDQTQVSFMLQDTDAYKQRFAGNEIRRKQGLGVLNPAEYLSAEASYRQIMQQAGLPRGFYDQPSDFSNWIGNNVSPTEINDRVNAATDAAHKLDSGTQQAFAQWYGIGPGELASYFLDMKRALPVIQNQARAVMIGGSAIGQGGLVTQQRAEQLAGQTTVAEQQLGKTEGEAVLLGQRGSQLAGIYGGQYNQATAENELFLNDAQAAERRKRLGALEAGSFTGGQVQQGKTQLGQAAASY